MSEEYRDPVYWGSGDQGRWFRKRIDYQKDSDPRFRGSTMRFVRYAVEYALKHDQSLKPYPDTKR